MRLTDAERGALNAAMDRYAEGNEAAFAVVYDILEPVLTGFFVPRTGGDRARVEDLVQETFEHMHLARRNYVTGSYVLPWVFAIARNLLIDAHRRTWREILFTTAEDDAAALDLVVDRSSIPDDLAVMRQMAEIVRAALDRLPACQRAVFDLREEGLSEAETASVLGKTAATVKMAMHHARIALRKALGLVETPETP
jgi:RNA polymerase sigma-70 factor, ECF subfamily